MKILAVETVTVTWLLYQYNAGVVTQHNVEVRQALIKSLQDTAKGKGFKIGEDLAAKLEEAHQASWCASSSLAASSDSAATKAKRRKVRFLVFRITNLHFTVFSLVIVILLSKFPSTVPHI